MKGVTTFFGMALTVGFLIGGVLANSAPATAQSDICGSGRKLFEERQSIMSRINSWQKAKVNPVTACRALTQLQGNGVKTLEWLETNKDWCQVPDQAVDSLKAQQSQVAGSRNNACKAAADYNRDSAEARKQAQRAQQGGNAGFAGVDDFSGAPRPVPRGAL